MATEVCTTVVGVRDVEAVVCQGAAIVDDAVDAGAESAAGALGDIERPVECQIAADIDQVVERAAGHIGLAEIDVEVGIAERQIAVDGQRARSIARIAGVERTATATVTLPPIVPVPPRVALRDQRSCPVAPDWLPLTSSVPA